MERGGCARRSPGPCDAAVGFTLVEMLIVIAVIAVLAAAALPALNAVTGANARSAAGQLAGSLRWLFDTAALRHETCRMVLDLDGRAFWPQCTRHREGGQAGTVPSDEELQALFPSERNAEKRRLLAQAAFGNFEDLTEKPRTLPGDAAFVDVWSQHEREPLSKGRAYIYFYPHGQAELAQVPIVDGSNVYTVLVHPFTGHAKVVNGKREVPGR